MNNAGTGPYAYGSGAFVCYMRFFTTFVIYDFSDIPTLTISNADFRVFLQICL